MTHVGTRLAPLAPLMLPAALVAIPAAFQVTIMALGVSRQQAADAGWVLQPKVWLLAAFLKVERG